jgi:uncharacterized protein YecE (DUF72 family)
MIMALKEQRNFYSGTSNVVLPVRNKEFFPPEFQDKSRLNYYASLFNSVEINSSFYKIPMARTVEKWAADVPDDFRFTFKLWGGITHARGLDYTKSDIGRFLESVGNAAHKKGCLLVQFPASIKISYFHKIKNLVSDIHEASQAGEWKIAIEFRDKSWYNDTVYEWLEQYGAAIVTHDMPASSTPLTGMDTSFIYLRFHGEKGDYRGCYTDEFLEEYAAYIKNWLAEGKYVFTYFNNTMGDAVHNALLLNSF